MFYLLDHFTPGLSMSQWPSCLFFFLSCYATKGIHHGL